MIKKIIHCSDIHIRNVQRHEEYGEQLTNFIEMCRTIAEPYEKDEVRILISGDLIHQKNTISPELMVFASAFLRQLQEIAKVIVIAGNHDLIVNNTSRKDAITSLFETADFENTVFLDYELGFQSGYVVDDNVTWVVYSIYNDYLAPSLDDALRDYPNNKVVGLYHGMIVGAELNNGSVVDGGVDGDIFNGCHCVMAGDIHKQQVLHRGGIPIVYSGSLIQQTFGETITRHGFVVWNVETLDYEFVELPTEYGLYDFEIKSIEDVDNDVEILKNY